MTDHCCYYGLNK